MTLSQIYATGVKDAELAKMLEENGYSMVDFSNWKEFAKAMGYIK